MHLDPEHLHGRQIFRAPRFALGRKWRSPSTGKELIIVGTAGDADDRGRENALYAHAYYRGSPGERLYPELKDLFPGSGRASGDSFRIAWRVAEDGWCRPEHEAVCFPTTGRYGFFRVSLVGYGPTEWLPDGITGQEIFDRPLAPWRALAIWRHPDRMVSIASLQRGWVIRSEQFARAKPDRPLKPGGELRLYQDREDDAFDEARGAAAYCVESIDPEEDWEWDDGPEDYSSLRIRVRRLRDDGAYDPSGEVIEFRQQRHHRNAARNSPFHPVELVGQMAFDGSGMTATLPKPLTY